MRGFINTRHYYYGAFSINAYNLHGDNRWSSSRQILKPFLIKGPSINSELPNNGNKTQGEFSLLYNIVEFNSLKKIVTGCLLCAWLHRDTKLKSKRVQTWR